MASRRGRLSLSSVYIFSTIWLALLFAGCELPEPEEDVNVSIPDGPRIVTPSKDAGVLLVDEHLRFLAEGGLSLKPETYRETIEGLRETLIRQGIDAHIVSVDEGTVTLRQLADYRVLFLADTMAVGPELNERLRQYVQAGGVLVGIGEVARFDIEWDKDWSFGEVFGLKTLAVDPWGTGVSVNERGLYRSAERFNEDRILTGIGDVVDWGTNAVQAWITTPKSAKTVATFAGYTTQSEEGQAPQRITKRVPALTVNQVGRGIAIYIAVQPGGRRKGGWATAGHTGRVLANASRYASKELVLPEAEPELVIGRNQVAYQADWPKELVLRLTCDCLSNGVHGTYALFGTNNKLLRRGRLEPWQGGQKLWRSQYLVADFSDVSEPGDYRIEIDIPAMGQRVVTKLHVDDRMLSKTVAPLQMQFLRRMRCGERCHLKDPVVGGYHDATGDWAVRMWSMPHLIWGLTRYLEAHPEDSQAWSELHWGLEWCLQMQGADGAVYASIRPPGEEDGEGSPIRMRPWQDDTVRELERRYSFQYTATYAAALARAAELMKKHRDQQAQQVLRAAHRAFERVCKDEAHATSDLGNRAWAAVELCRATGRQEYLVQARHDIPLILERQLPRGRTEGAEVYGDFFANKAMTTFSPQQWKVFHSIGIYLGLIGMRRTLPETDALHARIDKALEDFAEGYLLVMSQQSPYGQMAHGLERKRDRHFKVCAFPHRGAWVKQHGLNCDMLAMATIALELNHDQKDQRLHHMALRQLNWLLGNNPLGYSMITGIGQHEAPLISHKLGTGHIDGGIPNGIAGRGSHNLPFWGPSWGSREYWLPHNAYLLSTIGLLDKGQAQ